MYTIGVVIPIYHGRGKVEKALDSLVTQTFKDFEVCLSNDCDGDSYDDIITEYVRRDLTIKYTERNMNGGPGMARQSGIDTIIDECKYLMFMDQDDVMMPICLEYAYASITNGNFDACQCTFIEETDKQFIVHPGASTHATWHHGKIYKTEFLKKYNIRFSEQLKWNEDCYFNVVAMNLGRTTAVDTCPIYLWRYNAESATHKEFMKFFKKAWDTFAASQVLALIKIWNADKERLTPELCGSVTREIYIHCQNGIANGMDESRIYKWLDLLRLLSGYRAALKTHEFWNMATQTRTTTYVNVEENKLFIPKENILDWIKRLISTEVWDDIYS